MRTETETQPSKINEFHIEHNGHKAFYKTHQCPTCETSWECLTTVCRLEHTVECLPCATQDVITDIERIAQETLQFLRTKVPTDPQGLMWWKSLGLELEGKLKGLVTRSKELINRQEEEEA